MNAQELWQQLAATALIGSDARALPDFSGATPLHDALAALDRADGNSAGGTLLAAAGMSAWYLRAGRMAPKDALCQPGPAPGPDNLRAPYPPAAAACLAEILHGDFKECLDEWLNLTQERQISAPLDQLPRLLDLGRQDIALRKRLLPLLDRRGVWLAGLNPAWAWAQKMAESAQPMAAESAPCDTSSKVWEEGSLARRRDWLRQVRLSEPDRGRALLQAVLPSEKAEAREGLLACLEVNLEAADEAMLEAALGDRAKGVRKTAISLLARLPDSAWLGRMRARLAQWLTIDPGSGVDVRLPATCAADAQRDGIDPKPPQGTGEKAWWLRQGLGLLPPADWLRQAQVTQITQITQITAAQLLALCAASEWRADLLAGFEAATLLYRDAEMADALLAQGSESAALVGMLPEQKQEQLLLGLLDDIGRDFTEEKAIVAVHRFMPLYSHWDAKANWSPEASAHILRSIKQMFKYEKTGIQAASCFQWMRSWLDNTLPKLDLRTLAEWIFSHDEAERPGLIGAPAQASMTKHLDLINFRIQMQAAFGPPSTLTNAQPNPGTLP